MFEKKYITVDFFADIARPREPEKQRAKVVPEEEGL